MKCTHTFIFLLFHYSSQGLDQWCCEFFIDEDFLCNLWTMDLTATFLVLSLVMVIGMCEPNLKDDKGNLFGFQPLNLDDLLLKKRHSSGGQQPCTCGVFLKSQVREKDQPPRGHPVLLHEQSETLICGPVGFKTCISRCLDQVVKYLPKSADILCAAVEDDCYRERAFLYIKNCEDKWMATNMSAGREFCCKDNSPIKCSTVDAQRRDRSNESRS